MQAQTLIAVVYRTKKHIQIPFHGEGKYPVDIAYTGEGSVAVSFINTTHATSSVKWGYRDMESDKNRKLFTCPTYITENGNGDISVSDVGAVVVTDQGGMLKFRYVGLSENHHFDPYGICCDSGCNIIIADMKNDKIHKIDQNGEFLHYIQYDGMKMPRALCIDENDNIYVGEWNCDVIKVVSRD